MFEKGTVKKIEGNYAVVEMDGGECKTCSARLFCGGEEKRTMKIENNIGTVVGDRVTVEIPKRSFYISLSLIFIIPIILLIGGFLIFNQFFSETISGLISLALLVIWFFILKYIDGYQKGNVKLKAVNSKQRIEDK